MARIEARLRESLGRAYERCKCRAAGDLIERIHLCVIDDQKIRGKAHVGLVASFPELSEELSALAHELARGLDHESIVERVDDRAEPPPIGVLRKFEGGHPQYRLMMLPWGPDEGRYPAVAEFRRWMRCPAGSGSKQPKDVWTWRGNLASKLNKAGVRHMLVLPITDRRLSTEAAEGQEEERRQVLSGLAYVQLGPRRYGAALDAVEKSASVLQELKNDLMTLWSLLLCYESVTSQTADETEWVSLGDIISPSLVEQARQAISLIEHQEPRSQTIGSAMGVLKSSLQERHLRRRRGMTAICDHALRALKELADDMKVPEIGNQAEKFYKHEQRLFLDPRYREHFVHQFQVYLLGICMISNRNVARLCARRLKYCNQRFAQATGLPADSAGTYSIEDMHRCWFVAAAMHDVAAALADARAIPGQLADTFSLFESGFQAGNPFSGVSWSRNRDDGGITASVTDLLAPIGLYHEACCADSWSSGKNRPVAWTEVGATWDTALVRLLETEVHHAVLGAALVIRAGIKSLRSMPERKRISDLCKIYLPAAHAVLLHDADCYKALSEAALPGRPLPGYLILEDHPVAGLLALADLIHNWGRPSVGKYRELPKDCRLHILEASVRDGSVCFSTSLEYAFVPDVITSGLDIPMQQIKNHYEAYRSYWRIRGHVQISYYGSVGGMRHPSGEPFHCVLRHPDGGAFVP